jgi:hypothetical protein
MSVFVCLCYKTLNWIHIKNDKKKSEKQRKKNSIKNESHLEKMIISKEHEDKNSSIQFYFY